MTEFVRCDAESYDYDDADYGLPCSAAPTREVLCSDCRWHPRCDGHVPVHFGPHRIRPVSPPLAGDPK